MTIDELLQKHPLPWHIADPDYAGEFEPVDSNRALVVDRSPETAQAICEAMAELVRLRSLVAVYRVQLDALSNSCDEFWEQRDTLRARVAELERINRVQFQALIDLAHGEEAQCLVARLHEGTLECRVDDLCAACIASHRVAEQDAELATLRAFRERMMGAPGRLAAHFTREANQCRSIPRTMSSDALWKAEKAHQEQDAMRCEVLAVRAARGEFDTAIFGEGGEE